MDIPGVDIPDAGDVVGGIGGFLGGLADEAGRAIVDYVILFIYDLIAQAVASITAALASSFNGDSTRVDLVGGWFASEGGATVTAMTSVIAGSLVLVFLLLSLLRAMLAGEFSSMWRAAFVDVPVAFLATALTVVVASALLAMVDEASATLLGAEGEQLAAFGQSLTDVEQLSVAGLLGILFGLLFIVGAVLVWVQLLVRAVLIYIVIAFAPITWVTRAYPGTRSIARRGAEIGIALIVSKFVMAISFRLGAEALGAADVVSGEADLSAMLVGSAIMLMTAFMPWLIFKVIPAVDTATSSSAAQGAAVGAAVIGGGLALGGISKLAGMASTAGSGGLGSGGGPSGSIGPPGDDGVNGSQGPSGSAGGGPVPPTQSGPPSREASAETRVPDEPDSSGPGREHSPAVGGVGSSEQSNPIRTERTQAAGGVAVLEVSAEPVNAPAEQGSLADLKRAEQ